MKSWLIVLAIVALALGPEAIQGHINHERWRAVLAEAARYGIDADLFAAACDNGEDGVSFETDAAWIAGKCWEIRHPSKADDGWEEHAQEAAHWAAVSRDADPKTIEAEPDEE